MIEFDDKYFAEDPRCPYYNLKKQGFTACCGVCRQDINESEKFSYSETLQIYFHDDCKHKEFRDNLKQYMRKHRGYTPKTFWVNIRYIKWWLKKTNN